jgi:hypothetical protein
VDIRAVVAALLFVAFAPSSAAAQPALQDLLIDDAAVPASFAPIPELTGPVGERLRWLARTAPSQRDAVGDSLRDLERLDDAYMRAWLRDDGRTQITAFIADAGDDETARAFLADTYAGFELPGRSSFNVLGVPGARGSATLSRAEVAFRRGSKAVLVAVDGSIPPDTELAVELAGKQLSLLPDGPSDADPPPPPSVAETSDELAGRVAANLALAALLYLVLVRRVRFPARRRRRTPLRSVAATGMLRHDVSAAIGVHRRVGRAVATAQVLGALPLAIALMPVMWPDSLWSIPLSLALLGLAVGTDRGSKLAALGLAACAVLFVAPVVTEPVAALVLVPLAWLWLAGAVAVIRADGDRAFPGRRSYLGSARTRYRRLFTGRRPVTVVLLLLGTLLALLVAFILVAGQGLRTTAPENPTADTLQQIVSFALAFGLVLAAVALYRRARLAAQLPAERVEAADRRPHILLLRNFADDTLLVDSSRTSRHAWLEGLDRRRRQRFEEVIAGHLWRYGPVLTVARPGETKVLLGAARSRVPDDEWRPHVRHRIEVAGRIVIILGRSEGLAWEIGAITDAERWDRTIIVIPPSREALTARWLAFRLLAERAGAPIASLPEGPIDDTLTLVSPADGDAVAYVADRRDEVAYEVALHAAAARLNAARAPVRR